MDTLQLLVDEHRPNYRQGPGDDTETMRALSLAGLDRSRRLKIADIGCGTGASSFVLARELDCAITAVDEEEIRMYETSGAYYGYGLYVAK